MIAFYYINFWLFEKKNELYNKAIVKQNYLSFVSVYESINNIDSKNTDVGNGKITK